MKRKNLKQWRDYLENLHLRSIDLELGRIQQVFQQLNLAQPNCPVITVAGTNGKGSVVALLESILIKEGYCVAAYTSPYLVCFNEQFRINHHHISDDDCCRYFEIIDGSRGKVTLTLFEYKFLAALLYFQDQKPDVMILEVGLGGRLDAVNIIDPTIAVITSISLDHCDWLGDTREAIGREKAGIFRKNQKAVCGDINPPATIAEAAKASGTEVYYQKKDFDLDAEYNWSSANKTYQAIPKSTLLKDNIATALMVIELLQEDLSISEAAIREGVEQTFLAGRQQIISEKPLTIVDVAHNADSVARLAEFLRPLTSGKKVKTVFSALKTKDLSAMIQSIGRIVDEWHIAEISGGFGHPIEKIDATLVVHGAHRVIHYSSIKEAYQQVQNTALPNEVVLVFGSFHVVGEVISCIS